MRSLKRGCSYHASVSIRIFASAPYSNKSSAYPSRLASGDVKVILSAVDDDLATAWEHFCGDLPCVQLHRGSILDLECDAIVSPANSFGFMDGGIDALYARHFGSDFQRRVRSLIQTKHHGELPVGMADIVETDNLKIPHVILAPTMRVPMVLQDSANPYLAARAVFLLVLHGTKEAGANTSRRLDEIVRTLAIPGLGTGVGQIGVSTCAQQVRTAIKDFVLGQFRYPQSWAEASERHQLLYTDRVRNLQR